MLSLTIIVVLCLPALCDGRIFIYDTENITSSSEKFDCIYVLDNVNPDYAGSSAGKVPYCRRPNMIENLTRVTNKCENGGQLKYFVDLFQDHVRPFEVLKWNSSIEMADKYAAFYYNNYKSIESNDKQDFLCHCTQPSTFGKYCEYQLTHEANSFETSQSSQAYNRYDYSIFHQVAGDIVCYKTLSCYSGPLCLDWRNICDGIQQCDEGWDEENCDKLEFNECEVDEFRCQNGMCISEEYFLDGDNDCMDWIDERNRIDSIWCFYETTTTDCSERICQRELWSCGDGQCILWQSRLIFLDIFLEYPGCLNEREMNYMCELHVFKRSWTLPNGLCWHFEDRFNDSDLSINNDALSEIDKCVYLIRCALSDGYELDCPCNRLNCSEIMQSVCDSDSCYEYPRDPLIRPYVFICYDSTSDFKNKLPYGFVVKGYVKCRGYSGYLDWFEALLPQGLLKLIDSELDSIVCSSKHVIWNNDSSMKYDGNCWNNSRTFNNHPYAVYDVCKRSQQCISQYRVKDGNRDCRFSEDEFGSIEKDLCTRVRKHRFQCSVEQPTCLTLFHLGDSVSQCSNRYDERLYGGGRALFEMTLGKCDPASCQLLKEYIKNSTLIFNSSADIYSYSHPSQSRSTSRISFRSYCDAWWNLPGHIDELSQYCQNWACHQDQYQCQTGQCILLDWVCDEEWDCADASDEEAIVTIRQWSQHNQQLEGLGEKLQNCNKLYSNLPFSEFCEKEKEFPCLRSNVSDPLDMKLNRPCIPYSKIGDHIEDCYNAYDEKNTFEARGELMWGFSLRCGHESFSYLEACEKANKCVEILCPHRHYQLSNCSKPNDAVCINDSRCVPGGRCDRKRDCLYGEDEYWCTPTASTKFLYRYRKVLINDQHAIFEKQEYPSNQLATQTFSVLPQSLSSRFIRMKRDLQNSDVIYSFWCNNGVTVILLNQRVCLCPPAYFGDKCQFFNDRITIVTHLDLITWPSLSAINPIVNMTMPPLFNIQVNFLFNGISIDHYEFYSNTTFEIHNYIKHKFYMLYSRSTQMTLHKKARFFNRTDIEQNHPYSVHFNIYALYSNESIPIALGLWQYPIYFDFLPSFRLATILRFPKWLENATLHPCANYPCNQNSICKPIFNQNNSYICTCRTGFYGENCSKYETACDSYCSPYSFCQPNRHSMITHTDHPFCICPLGHFGPRCFLKFEQCNSSPCSNNGSCIYTYETYSGDSFKCVCSKFFYGERCQHSKIPIQIRINTSITIELPRASTVQFYDVDSKTFQLVLRHQQVIQGFPSTILWAHGLDIAPPLGVLKTHYDATQPKYFIIYLRLNTSTIDIASPLEHCPLAASLLNKSDMPDVPDVFKYHSICQNNSQRLCFVDSDYLCICQWDHYRVDCFLHDIGIDLCGKCLSNGKCIKGDTYDDNDFICLCPRCYQGRLCEFNMQAFGFSLDSLLVNCSRKMMVVYFSMAILLFIVGFFNNLCSFVTFKRPTPRKFGVGNYLFLITCFNQMSLLFLLVKFIQIVFAIINLESCKIVSYLFTVLTRSTYWLTSWVTIDRLFIVFFPTSTALKNPRLAIGISVFTLLCLFGMHIHEVIYYTVIQHISTGSSICVTNFNIYSISTYNRISTLIHYLLPFFIQVIGITLLIVLAARSRNKTTNGKIAFRQVLIKQFHMQKELYTTPTIIILSALPQTVLTFSLACKELAIWHRHALLITYLLSYAPQILGYILYVLPSSTYKKEFSETSLAKILSWIFNEKKSATTAR